MAFALRCAALLAACAASLACSRSSDSVLRSGPSYEGQHSAKGLDKCQYGAAHALANACAMSHCRARFLDGRGQKALQGCCSLSLTWAKRAMAAMAAAREAMDCSMRAWLALPIALPSAAAAAFAACGSITRRSALSALRHNVFPANAGSTLGAPAARPSHQHACPAVPGGLDWRMRRHLWYPEPPHAALQISRHQLSAKFRTQKARSPSQRVLAEWWIT